MAQKKIDCTTDVNNRKEAIEFLDQLRRGLMYGNRQFEIVDSGTSDSGSREVLIRTNGLKMGETLESRAAVEAAEKAAATAQTAADDAKAKAEAPVNDGVKKPVKK